MANVGDINIAFTANMREMTRAFESINNRLSSLETNIGRTRQTVSTSSIAMGNVMASAFDMAVRAIVGLIKKLGELSVAASRTAIEFENNMMQVSRIFGVSTDSIENFASSQAKAFGMSTAEAIKFSTIYGNLLSSVADSQEENSRLTQRLLKQSAVVASATGRTMTDTMERIRSGLLGNTEAIEDLGINVNVAMIESTEAFRRFANNRSWGQLDFKTQQQIRLFAILEQSVTKYGTTINRNVSTNLQKLNSILEDAKLKLGQAFLPLIEKAVPILIEFAEALVIGATMLKQMSDVLFGTEKTAKKASDAQVQLSKDIKKAGDSAKKSLAPFDEIITLQDKLSDTTVETKFKTTGEQAETTGIVERVAEFKLDESVIENLKELRKAFGDLSDSVGDFKDETEFVWKPLGEITKGGLKLAIKGLTTAIDFLTISFEGLKKVLGIESETKVAEEKVTELKTAFEKIDWNQMKENANSYIEKITGINFAETVETVSKNWEDLKTKTSTKWESIKKRVNDTKNDIKNLTWEDITNKVEQTWKDSRKKTNDWLWSIWQRVKMSVSDIAEKSGWNTITDSVSNMWDSVKTKTMDIWRGIRLTIAKSAKTIVEVINEIIKLANKVRFTVPDVPFIPFAGQTFGLNVGTIDTSGIEATISSIERETAPTQRQFEAFTGGAGPVSNQGAENRPVNIILDGVTIGRGILPYLDDERDRIGTVIVEGG